MRPRTSTSLLSSLVRAESVSKDDRTCRCENFRSATSDSFALAREPQPQGLRASAFKSLEAGESLESKTCARVHITTVFDESVLCIRNTYRNAYETWTA
ncbi:hypothetical protein Tco_0007696 [Tanacetum coccineum]